MKDSQPAFDDKKKKAKYIKESNERFSTLLLVGYQLH